MLTPMPKTKQKKIKAWIWKDFSLKTAREYNLQSLIQLDAPKNRLDFVKCIITYQISIK